MKKIKIGDKEFEVPEDLADAFNTSFHNYSAEMDKLMVTNKKMKDKMEKAGITLGKGEDSDDDDETGEDLEAMGEDGDDEDPKKAEEKMDSIKGKNPFVRRIKRRISRLLGKYHGAKTKATEQMDALKPENLTKTLESRMKLIAVAQVVMDNADTKKLLAMSEADLKKSIIAAKNSTISLEGKSADFIDGMFETIAVKVSNDELGKALSAIVLDGAGGAPGKKEEEFKAPKVWKAQPLSASRSKVAA